MSINMKGLSRFLLVMARYPGAALSFAFRAFEIVPGMRRTVQHPKDRIEQKNELRSEGQSVGHALGDRTVSVSFLGRKFLSARIREGVEATADQFYLNRSVSDLNYLVSLVSPYVTLRPGDTVFDPGCGTGRHLFYLSDHYGTRGIGIDVYPAAIEVANAANWDGKCEFHCQSSLEPGCLDTLLPDGCEFVFMNSWLNHVRGYGGFQAFTDEIVDKCDHLLIINTAKEPLDTYFKRPDIVALEIRDGSQFALLRGGRAPRGANMTSAGKPDDRATV